ncbi:class I SAM-dependent methyltransferase [Candidatus Methanomassiliicoccus intestinalis]|uniref:class I SAM-dependent methyltransferase n=1 Tax=Candidatus Methanomassiliicoccus intestinalis TaxID=1406512 RepID=UPI0037DDA5FC
MLATCLKVPREKAESIRRRLIESGLLDISFRIKGQGEFILIPVVSKEIDCEYEFVEEELQSQEKTETDYKNIVKMPAELKDYLPASYDIIGEVIIIKLDEELQEYRNEIGNALLKVHPNISTVAEDRGVKGELRVRDLNIIAGKDKTETMHTEHGVRLLLDPAYVYFNPRLATERHRITSLVKDDEIVVDMFAGVGPYSVMIAKYAKPKIVFSMDLNPYAIDYLKRNIEINKVENIIPLEGDSAAMIHDLPPADRIIMNLPHSAHEFFYDALTCLNPGGTIHFYTICERDSLDSVFAKLSMQARSMGSKITIDRLEELKTYSPTMSVYSADIRFSDLDLVDDW